MTSFPSDVPLDKAIKTFECLGFHEVRRGNHVSMIRENEDGTQTPLTMPAHRHIKGSTLRTILTQSHISRKDFLAAFDKV